MFYIPPLFFLPNFWNSVSIFLRIYATTNIIVICFIKLICVVTNVSPPKFLLTNFSCIKICNSVNNRKQLWKETWMLFDIAYSDKQRYVIFALKNVSLWILNSSFFIFLHTDSWAVKFLCPWMSETLFHFSQKQYM